TPFTFISPAEVVAQLGAKPVFCDIDPKTFNIDPSKIPSKITKKTRAIIPVHLFGQMAEMDSISNISQKAGLEIIEDAAQAIGATYKKKQIGGFGKIACLSFYPTKNLGGYGDGGMAVSDNKKIADKIAWLRIHGSKEKYYYNMLGYGARLDTIQAAILRVKLKHLRKWTRARQKVARIYDELLSDSPIAIPYRNPNCNHVFHIYCIRAPQRDGLRDYLAKKDIPTFIYYPLGLHLQEAFRYLGYRRGSFPETEKACRETLALPIYPEITTSEQEYVCEEIKKFYKK
ncbi:transcriptional regulator, partial [bacterium (Candidatus Torokbacteria) CG_4_10_14_0_2_um_filter_35_8]